MSEDHTTEAKDQSSVGRPREVARETVIAAGEKLVADGKTVTGSKLRKVIGRGSPSVLLEIWQEYVASNESEDSATATSPLPDRIQEELDAASGRLMDEFKQICAGMYRACSAEAERRLTTEREELRRERAQAAAEARDASDLVDDAECRVSQLEDHIKDLERRLDEERNRRTDAETAAAQGDTKVQTLEQQVSKLESERDRQADARRGVEQQLATAVAQRDEAQERATQAEADRRDMQERIHDQAEKFGDFLKEKADLQSELDRVRRQDRSQPPHQQANDRNKGNKKQTNEQRREPTK